jgi:SanA protein
MPISSKQKMIIIIFFTGGGLFLLFIGAINVYIISASKKFRYDTANHLPRMHTAVILGAVVDSTGRLSNALEDRVLTGLKLYQKGNAKKLLLSGDHGQVNYDEVNSMRQYLLKKGVPPQDLFMDHAGFRTYDSMYRARDIFQVHDAIIVTQKFHLARAVYTARALGIDAVGINADRRWYPLSSRVKLHLREVLARVKAFLDLHVWKAKPKFLGDIIPITGDGRKTWDKP